MKIIVLDRDGVINEDSPDYIKSPEEWVPINGSLEAIAMLTNSGYQVVVATNQAGIDRKIFNMDSLNLIHKKMHSSVRKAGGNISAIFYCPCLEGPDCHCRKPKPGMLVDIALRYNVTPQGIPYVGDSLKDLQAASAAKYLPVLVLTGNGKKTQKMSNLPTETVVYPDLREAVIDVLNKNN